MIGYTTLGTNDFARATRFYDALLGELGAKRMMETERFVFWSVASDRPALGVFKPYDTRSATAGNGTMVALAVDSPAKVDAMHRKALELGATDEGPPGPRAFPGFYAGYFRDLDGNKLNFYCFTN
jgi:catechol 2,3-dioxygenase-like lactoylglutathione lyase family enzyme